MADQPQPPRRRGGAHRIRRRRGPVALAAAAGFLLIAVGPAGVMAPKARTQMQLAKSQMLAAANAIRELKPQQAGVQLEAAQDALGAARSVLRSPLLSLSRATPVIRANLQTTGAIVEAGHDVLAAGKLAVQLAGSRKGADFTTMWTDGKLDVARLAEGGRQALQIERHLARAQHRISNTGPRWALLPEVRRARNDFETMVVSARRQAAAASGVTFLLSRVFGASGPRTWAIGAQNNAELRGRGGYLGSLGLLQADSGRVTLGAFQSVEQLGPLKMDRKELLAEAQQNHYLELGSPLAWPNLTMNPHFPDGARLLLSNLARTGVNAGGLIAVDPVAMSYLLEVTGPVSVAGIPESLSSANFAHWALNRIYFVYEQDNQQRRDTLAAMADAVWRKALNVHGVDPGKLATAFGRGLSEGRIVIYSSDPKEQALIQRLGIGAAIDDRPGDYLMLIGQNFGENKLDYYAERKIDYRGTLRDDGALEVSLEIGVSNHAPSGGSLPAHVGGERPRINLPPGVARGHFSIFVPGGAELSGAQLDGKPVKVTVNNQSGKKVFGKILRIAPGATRRLSFRYVVPDAIANGSYRLWLQNQATVRPDSVTVKIMPPPRASVAQTSGFSDDLTWQGAGTSLTALSAEIDLPGAPAAVVGGLYAAGLAMLLAGLVLMARRRAPGDPQPKPADTA